MRAIAETNVLVGRRARRATPRRAQRVADIPADVVIRRAGEGDEARLRILSALDSARPLAGPALVAERNGALIAAIALDGGRTVADPFVASAPYVELLELRAAALGAAV
jgi:hypothetical protein